MDDLKALRDEMQKQANDSYAEGKYEDACTTTDLQCYADSLTSIIERNEKERAVMKGLLKGLDVLATDWRETRDQCADTDKPFYTGGLHFMAQLARSDLYKNAYRALTERAKP